MSMLVPRRLRVLAGVAAAAAAVALVPAAGAAVQSTGDAAAGAIPTPGYPTVEQQRPWRLIGSASTGRALVVDPGYGGTCGGAPRAVATETAARIEVQVLEAVPAPGASIACPAIARLDPPITVRLARPIAGRKVRGPRQLRPTPFGYVPVRPPEASDAGEGRRIAVPDLRGLAPGDATTALCLHGLRGVVRGTRGRPGVRVLRQDPRAGRTLPWRGAGARRDATCSARAVHDLPRVTVRVGRR